jgi:hypothetical protein
LPEPEKVMEEEKMEKRWLAGTGVQWARGITGNIP